MSQPAPMIDPLDGSPATRSGNRPGTRRFTNWLACAFVGLSVVAPPAGRVHAADPVPPGSPVPSDPVFHAHLIDGTTFAGRIHQIGPGGAISLVPNQGPEQVVPADRLLKLTREGPPPYSTGVEGSLVLFPEGDRLYRTVIGSANDTTLDVQSYALGNVAIPLESMLGLVLTMPGEASAVDALLERVRAEPRTSEVLWLANGDRLAGGLLALNEKAIKLQVRNAPIDLERVGVVALGFDPAVVAYPRPEGDFFELTLVDGSRLGVSDVRIEQGQVVGKTRFKHTIHVALAELAQVHARTSRIAYLSDRPTTAEQYVGYVGPTRPYRRNLNVDGHTLRVAGQGYDRGLGTQARTLLAYRLEPGDTRFQALVGVDDGAGLQGSVAFRVLVDGKERLATPPMSVRDTPKRIDIDLAGAKVLILATEFGERGDVRDLADWIEARIIR
jgi:hypothetical protein